MLFFLQVVGAGGLQCFQRILEGSVDRDDGLAEVSVRMRKEWLAMYFVFCGVLLLVLKLTETGPVGTWSWWAVLAPFAGAAVWWAWSDATGYTKRRAMERMDNRKADRRQRNMDALGTGPKRK
jgi:small Trp-rich protein